MSLRVPSIFLSSTFYDLRQVRADIATFVERELGYRLIASEYNSFPVDPQADAVENCRRRVAEDADVLVLVVGARYGSIPIGESKSVTNIEYLAARAKRIPVFAFVHRDVIALLPVHAHNPDADFHSVVDDPKLFDFVNDLRKAAGVWTFAFDLASEVVNTLRIQLAYQMGRGLDVVKQMTTIDADLLKLHGRAFQLAVERPDGWEASLFTEILEQEIFASDYLRRDHELEIAIGSGAIVTDTTAKDWIVAATLEPQRLVSAAEAVARAASQAFPNEDLASILYCARRFGQLYREAFEWAARLRRSHVPDNWQPVVSALAKMLDQFVVECRAFLDRTKNEISAALASSAGADDIVRIRMTFKFDVDNSLVMTELAKLREGR
jgi:hypothetical protein